MEKTFKDYMRQIDQAMDLESIENKKILHNFCMNEYFTYLDTVIRFPDVMNKEIISSNMFAKSDILKAGIYFKLSKYFTKKYKEYVKFINKEYKSVLSNLN